jgi:hypothetical protein
MTDATINWVATLSDGSTATEHSGEYTILSGERKPWVRLTRFLADNDLHLTSLRLNFRGRTIHMPRQNFGRFGLNEQSRPPLFYSLAYFLEGEINEAGEFGEKHFVDLVAHFAKFDVHYVHDLQEGNTSWVLVTEGYNPMAPTPLNKELTTRKEVEE